MRGILLYMGQPKLVSDSFNERQEARTTSGAFNKSRVEVTNKRKAANDNYRGTSRNVVVSQGRRVQRPVAANDNPAWLATKVRAIENDLENFDLDDLEEFMELYGEQLTEKTRGLIGKALLARKYYKVTLLNWSIIGWGMTLWSVQFWLALVSLATIGVVGAMDYVKESSTVGKFIITVGEGSFNTFLEALSAILDLDEVLKFDPTSVMMLTILIPFLIGLSTLLIMGFLYQITFVNCLFGNGSDIKLSLFIFAIFGYFTPILNLVPWFIFWLLAVWRYPK